MRVALFVILPYPSHYNLCFNLAQELKKRNYKVIYTGLPHLKNHVEQQGFLFYVLRYATEYRVRTFRGFLGFFLRSLLDKKDVIRRYREWYESIIEIRKAYEYTKPDIIFIDGNISFYYLCLAKYEKPIIILGTTFSTKKTIGVPPLNSLHVPKKTILSKILCEFLWMKHSTLRRIQSFKKKIVYLNRDEIFFWKRLCRKLNLDWDSVFDRKTLFYRSLKDVPIIIPAPKDIEFDFRSRPNEFYLNLPIDRKEEVFFSERYLRVREQIETAKKDTEAKVAYCAFGTLSLNDSKQVLNFFNKLTTAVSQQNEWLLVISVGRINFECKTQNNIFLIDRVPQLDILDLSDVMITHGGLNSVKECLQKNVPMLIYPLNMKVDQPGNATRIYKAGYGLFGKIEKDTSKDVLRKLNIVSKMKKNMKYKEQEFDIDQHF